jgi:GMP synthase (glutamine-hydrolysing)
MAHPDLAGGIAVLDFGGQYSHLICRRVRGLGVYSALLPYDTPIQKLKSMKVAGVILSGGPESVYSKKAPKPDGKLFDGEVPLLGICYGYQLLVKAHGGEVAKVEKREYGRSKVTVTEKRGLFDGIEKNELSCWMSHTDAATRIPRSLRALASSDNSPYAAVVSSDGKQFGVQFHPEVSHTEGGQAVLSNFVFNVCGASRTWSMRGFLQSSLRELAMLKGRVLCAVSGGVDSSVTAALLHRAVGDRLVCVFIDTGLLREGEGDYVRDYLAEDLGVKVAFVDSSKKFLRALRGVSDPEEKRKIVGKTFAEAFEDFAKSEGPFAHLAQGTLYPDVIESGKSAAPASVIKTHHNVGGLPTNISMNVVEPLRELYKDEVRALGAILMLPPKVLQRHPFPGPGLAVRVVGGVTEEKLRISREASKVVEDVLTEEGMYNQVWQAFAYVGDDRVTGVFGDERKTGHEVTVKVVESLDAMTADWTRLPWEVLQRISNKITNEVEGVVSVAYSVSSKPPATIEPQ